MHDGNEPTILLVEDDDIDARVVTRSFRKHNIGNPIVRAENGIEALAILRADPRSPVGSGFIVLLDLNMPRMSGHEFLAELRRDPALRHTVVFVLTTSGDPVDIDRAYSRAVAGYLIKTEAGDDFLRLVKLVDSYVIAVRLPRLLDPTKLTSNGEATCSTS